MIEKKDFIEIEYTGKLADEDIVFDTTDEKTAKQAGLHEEHLQYGPVTICVGEGQILEGLDKKLVGKKVGQEFEVKVPPEDGFGKKKANLLKLLPARIFKERNVQLIPGLQVNIDGAVGTIKRVSGGRVIVDFNHPLASKDLVYEVKINKKIEDDKEKVESLVKLLLNEEPEVTVEDKKATVKLSEELNKEVENKLKEEIKELIGLEAEINS